MALVRTDSSPGHLQFPNVRSNRLGDFLSLSNTPMERAGSSGQPVWDFFSVVSALRRTARITFSSAVSRPLRPRKHSLFGSIARAAVAPLLNHSLTNPHPHP